MQVNILDAKNRLSELVKCAQAGEDVVIANRGQPVVQLIPIAAAMAGSGKVGNSVALLAWLKHRPVRPILRDHSQIEHDIQAERAAWD